MKAWKGGIEMAFGFLFRKNRFNGLPEGFTVTFHTGFLDTEENTVEGVAKAVELDAQVIEVDVTFRDDGTPVILHAGSAGKDGGVLFDDAMAKAAEHPSCRLNLDIKSTANLPAVDEVIKKYGLMERAFYTGVSADWVDTVRKNSIIPYWLNHNVSPIEARSSSFPEKLVREIRDCGAVGLNSKYICVNSRIVSVLHENGIPVSIWTPCAEREMRACLALSPDNITTKRPDLLRPMVDRIAGK